MLSVVIPSKLSYPAMQLAPQPVHQRFVHPGPLVLRTAPLKYLTPTEDRDRTVSRRSEPSSRTALIGEQPNPWDLLQPQDAMSRHRTWFHTFVWGRLFLLLAPDVSGFSSPVGERDVSRVISVLTFTRVGVLPVQLVYKPSLSGQSLRG